MAQMVMRMVAISATDHVLGSAQYPCHVVDGHAELQQHRRTSVPQDVRGNIGSQSGKLPCGPPSPSLLRAYRSTCILDDVGSRGLAPASQMGQ
jgi:hypothetical protein